MITSAARGGASLHERSLLLAAQRHDWRAQEQLLCRYRPLLRATVRRFSLPGGVDRDDVAQEARIGFLHAIQAWRPERGAFAAFAGRCVHNQVLHALDTATANKHRVLSRALRFDQTDPRHWRESHGVLDCGEGGSAVERWASGHIADPEATVLAREQLAVLAGAMRALSEWERIALQASLNGVSQRELARDRGATVTAVKLALVRARRKLAAAAPFEQAG